MFGELPVHGVSATGALAFLVVPIVGAFFIDPATAMVIKLFLALPVYGL